MPGGNRQGPMGQGPKTGRGAGYCSGATEPGFVSAPGGGGQGRGGGGRGRGGNGGGGRGWRNMFQATGLTGWQRAMAAEPAPPLAPTPAPPSAPAQAPPSVPADVTIDRELASLQAQANEAATALDQIRQRIDEIASSKSQETAE